MTRGLTEDAVLARIRAAREEMPLCDHCLGRTVARVETGLTNDERGRIVRAEAGLDEVSSAACGVCQGLFDEVPKFVDLVLAALAPYEYDTYLVGTRVDAAIHDTERALWDAIGGNDQAEAVNTELNREIGRRVGAATGKEVEFSHPNLTAVVDTRFDHVTLAHGGLYVFGRYRKLTRDIPQTWWPCRSCRGRGCVDCDDVGKRYLTSVQELVQEPAFAATGATEAAFHGAGREDIDALCLGEGRPFILELKDPRVRTIDLAALERTINEGAHGRVEVQDLRLTEKAEVHRVKDSNGRKTYRARVRFTDPIVRERLLKGMEVLRSTPVTQRTPTRVEHRRADKNRSRRVLDIRVEEATDTTATLVVTGDAGLYIKELVSGDGGRTRPSVADLVGTAAVVQELDVIAVAYPPEDDDAATAKR